MNKRNVFLVLCMTVLVLAATAQDLVNRGDYVLRGTTLVKYQGKASDVVIPASLGITEIGAEAFKEAILRSITIPAGVKRLGYMAFANCYYLTTVRLPDSLAEIGREAFYGCGNLTTINFPVGLATIGGDAFYYCNSLTTISLPAGLTAIGAGSFSACSSLSGIQVDRDNRVYADQGGVLFNKSLTELIRYPPGKTTSNYSVPVGVICIQDGAFSRCESLTTISLPAGLTTIGIFAFSGCHRLATLNLPAGLTTIGDHAFYGCDRLATLNLPASLTTIGDGAFSGCERLTTISLPAGLSAIGENAFSDCVNLTAIRLQALTPPSLVDSLWGDEIPAIIYVPAAVVDAYKSAAGWKDYADRIRAAGN